MIETIIQNAENVIKLVEFEVLTKEEVRYLLGLKTPADAEVSSEGN